MRASAPLDTRIRAIAPATLTADQLPLGGLGIQVDNMGHLLSDLFQQQLVHQQLEAYGTSIPLVSAQALQILARRYKANLMGLLGAPSARQLRSKFEAVTRMWSKWQLQERMAVADMIGEEEPNNATKQARNCPQPL